MKRLNIDLPKAELEKEEKYLKDVSERIQEDILENTSKKQKVTEFIVEYRRNQIDEYRPDEDKVIDYFDHERFVQEEAYRAVDKRLNELQELSSSPYFGKVGFSEDDTDDEIYVGKYSLIDEDGAEPLVVDWRAPISSLFYKGSLGEASYEAPIGRIDVDITLRRQFMIRDGLLKGVFDSESDVKDEILMEVLSSKAGSRLKDIIMTIQEEQDSIIRDKREGVVVVNGVAGSGKTTIALHRTAYLLYNYRKMLEHKVLILGPNNIFMDYIGHVLPSLGEEGANQDTFNDLAMKLLEIEDSSVFSGEDFIEAILGGDEELIADTRRKRGMDFKSELEELIADVESSYYKPRDISYLGHELISADDWERLLTKDFGSLPYFRRGLRLKRLILGRMREVRDEKRHEIDAKYKRLRQSLSSEDEINQLDHARMTEIRALVATFAEKREEFSDLSRHDALEIYRKLMTFDFLTQEDLAPMLYMTNRLKGIKLPFEVRHIVLDEAQEHSPFHFLALKEITGCSSFTVVGDTNQMLLEGESVMNDLGFCFNDIRYFHLEKSYRSTQEIMEYANRFASDRRIVPLVRNGRPVDERTCQSLEKAAVDITGLLTAYRDTDLGTTAILTRDMETARRLYSLLKGKVSIKLIDTEDAFLTGSTYIMPSYYARGLEFDAVVVVSDKTEEDKQDLVMYIMATRALHALASVKIGQ